EGMRESEERMRQIFAHVSDALFIVDDSGTVLDANPAATELTGRKLAELRSTPLADVLPEVNTVVDDGDDRSRLAAAPAGTAVTRVLDIQPARFAPGARVYTVRELTNHRQLGAERAHARKTDASG